MVDSSRRSINRESMAITYVRDSSLDNETKISRHTIILSRDLQRHSFEICYGETVVIISALKVEVLQLVEPLGQL